MSVSGAVCFFCSHFHVLRRVLSGHCAAAKTQNATLHHVSGEEIASLIQINRGCGECLSDFSYINDVTCERTIGCTGCCGSHCKKMPLEKLPISQLIDGIPCKLCVVHSTPVIYTLGRSDGLGSMLGQKRLIFLVKQHKDTTGRHAINTLACVYLYGTHVCCILMFWIL